MPSTTCPKCHSETDVTRGACGACGSSLHPAAKDPNVGQIVDRKYRLVSLLGHGGMGMVYRAEHEVLRKEVAIKILSPAVSGDEKVRERFLREARVTAGLVHPHIVTALDAGVAGNKNLYIVMELVEGDALADRITRGPLAWPQVVRIAREVATALAFAHKKNLVHRDLKPANVMLEKDTDRAKVLDFGIARVIEDQAKADGTRMDLTRPGAGIGTLPYMSPEQLVGDAVDQRTDVYAFGVMLYEMLAGARPLRAETQQKLFHVILAETPPGVTQTNPKVQVPGWLEQLIMACLEKDKAARPATMEEVLQCLEQQRAPGQAAARGGGGGGGGSGITVLLLLLGVGFVGMLGGGYWLARHLGLFGGGDAVANNGGPVAVDPDSDEAKKRVAEAQRLAEEAERKKAQEEAARRDAEAIAAKKRAEEEATRLEADAMAAKKRAEEAEQQRIAEENRRKAEEEAKRKAREDAARRAAEEEAKRQVSTIRGQLQEALIKRDLDAVIGLVPALASDSTSQDLLSRDLPGWERLVGRLREAKLSSGSPLDRVPLWEAARLDLPPGWRLPVPAALDYEWAAADMYNSGKSDQALAMARIAQEIDPERHLARRVQASYLLQVARTPGEVVTLLGPYLRPEIGDGEYQENVIVWSGAVLAWDAAPPRLRTEALERLSTILLDGHMPSLRRARALKQRAGLYERLEDFPKAAQDYVDSLDEPDNPHRLDCHRALAEVLWQSPGADARVKQEALRNVEAAARIAPEYVEKFAAFLIYHNDEDGLIQLARYFVPKRELNLPAAIRLPILRFAATAGRRRNVDPKERKGWLDEAIELKAEARADDEAVADLHAMRGIVNYNLGRFPEAKRDHAALKDLVDRHAREGGAWVPLSENARKLGEALKGK